MNIATVFGFIFGIGILCVATYFSTEDVMVFINLPGIAIVLGGTLAATFICYPLREVMRMLKVFLMALGAEELPIGNYISECVYLSDVASKKGEAHLEKMLKGIDNEFLSNGLQMLVDGYSKDEIKEILDNRIHQYYEQETSAAGIYRTMSKFAPAFGIIGTLIGLIAMMQAMSGDMSQIGQGMATALTTTLYGALFANLFFLPIAIKVEKRIEQIVIMMSVIRDGILFIKDKTPSPIVLDKLKGYLPPRRWESIKRRKK